LIDVRSKSTPNGVQIEIVNRGSQFDLKKTAQLINPFYLDESVMHHSVGTGLGLSISQSLLKKYGSVLEFDNVNGTEAVVRFSLSRPNP
jgi:signal transduction histidine kinase